MLSNQAHARTQANSRARQLSRHGLGCALLAEGFEPQFENFKPALGTHRTSTLTKTLGAAKSPQPKQTALKTRGKQDVSASPAKAKQPPAPGTRKAGQSLEGLPQCHREQVPGVFKGNPFLERSNVHLLNLPQHKKNCPENEAWQAMQSYGVSEELFPSMQSRHTSCTLSLAWSAGQQA